MQRQTSPRQDSSAAKAKLNPFIGEVRSKPKSAEWQGAELLHLANEFENRNLAANAEITKQNLSHRLERKMASAAFMNVEKRAKAIEAALDVMGPPLGDDEVHIGILRLISEFAEPYAVFDKGSLSSVTASPIFE